MLACLALVTGLTLVAMTLLPHDPYARFAASADESPHYLRLRWIFERIHFDRTPIDVAFIGTSHTQSAIDSRVVESRLRTRGHDLHVVNFAIPHLGRDLHWVVVRELLEARVIRELVVEVQDFEPRAPHPAFQRVARVDDLLEAPIVVNTGYIENFVRLPRREFDLFAPAASGRPEARFVASNYEGAHWDDTEQLHGFTMARTGTRAEVELDGNANALRDVLNQKEALARRLVDHDGCSLLKRYNRHYLERLLALAREKKVHVTFLYLPFFHGPAQPTEAAFYRFHGDTMTPLVVLDDATSWLNVDHLNVIGARRTSTWIGDVFPISPGPTAQPSPTAAVAPCY